MEMQVARRVSRDALRNLEAHRVRINRLNVYPVPDGDTGTNMAGTVRAIVDALEASQATGHEVKVKSRPYTDPAYWAAWVLWGLPS